MREFNKRETLLAANLCLVSRSGNVSATASPVDMDIFSFLVFGIGELWLDFEGVGAEVVALSLK